MNGKIKLHGKYEVAAYRKVYCDDGPRVDKKGRRFRLSDEPIWEETATNAVTNEGLTDILDDYLRNQTQPTAWYLGLINNSPSPTLAAGDTLASHSGWSESADYDEAARQAWTPAAASSQSITNSASPAEFTMNGSVTIHGVFLCSASTGTSGILFSTAAFSGGNQAVADDYVLRVTYSVSASAA